MIRARKGRNEGERAEVRTMIKRKLLHLKITISLGIKN